MPSAAEVLQQFLTDTDGRFDLLADDVQYHFPESLGPGLGGTHNGKAEAVAMLTNVFNGFYGVSTIAPEVQMVFGSGEFAAAIFTMDTKTAWGEPYSNRYVIVIQCRDDQIAAVYEIFDTKHVFDTVDMTKFDPTARR